MNDTALPAEFADLQRYADLFAISDDVDRSTAVEQASREERHTAVFAVWPHMSAINKYLDEHGDEQAHLLGRLAEAVCEIQIEQQIDVPFG